MKTVRMLAACALPALAAASFAAAAQDVTLRIHHFLPPGATIQQKVFLPWCDKIGKESGGRLKCQIYPAMQLGGTPPQLFDQARDGVADVVWTLPTYQAGRFPKSEVFELPFMAKSAETGSPAFWEYVQKNAQDEFRGVKLLAAHLHDGSLFHFAGKQVKTMDDMKGLKVRAPTRIGTDPIRQRALAYGHYRLSPVGWEPLWTLHLRALGRRLNAECHDKNQTTEHRRQISMSMIAAHERPSPHVFSAAHCEAAIYSTRRFPCKNRG